MHIARGIESYSYITSANDGPVLVYRPRGEHYISQYVPANAVVVSDICWGCISHEEEGMLHRIRHLGTSVSAHFADCNAALCTNALSGWYNPFPGYRCRPTSKSLTDRRARLLWTPSTMCRVRRRGQCRKPDMSSLPESDELMKIM